MLEALGPVNCNAIECELGVIKKHLRKGAYVGDRCWEKYVLLVSKA